MTVNVYKSTAGKMISSSRSLMMDFVSHDVISSQRSMKFDAKANKRHQESLDAGLLYNTSSCTMKSSKQHSKLMSGENEQLFLPITSRVSNIVRLPTLLEPDVTPIAARRPKSECCLKSTRLPYGYELPSLNDHDSNLIPSVVKRSKTTGKRPNTSQSSTRNSNLSPAEKQAEISIFKLTKYKNLIKPEIKVTKTAISPKEFSKSSIINKKLLDEHVARENDSFDKYESKKSELIRWLRNSGQE